MFDYDQPKEKGLFYTMPLGIADVLIILAALRLAEKVFLKGSSPTDEDE